MGCSLGKPLTYINFVCAVPFTWHVSPYLIPCLNKAFHPSRQFGCHREKRISDYPSLLRLDWVPLLRGPIIHGINFGQLSHCVYYSGLVCLSLELDLLEIRDFRFPVPNRVYDVYTVPAYCLINVVCLLPIHNYSFNLLNSKCKMLDIFCIKFYFVAFTLLFIWRILPTNISPILPSFCLSLRRHHKEGRDSCLLYSLI